MSDTYQGEIDDVGRLTIHRPRTRFEYSGLEHCRGVVNGVDAVGQECAYRDDAYCTDKCPMFINTAPDCLVLMCAPKAVVIKIVKDDRYVPVEDPIV